MPDGNELTQDVQRETPNLDDSLPFDPFLRVRGEILPVMVRWEVEVIRATLGDTPRESSADQIKACLRAVVANLIAAENCSTTTHLVDWPGQKSPIEGSQRLVDVRI